MKIGEMKIKQEWLSMALLGVSGVMVLVMVMEAADFFATSARAEKIVAAAISGGDNDANLAKKFLEEEKQRVERLKKENPFAAPPAKPENPIKDVDIFGDGAFVNGKFCRVGDKVGDAEILAIEPTFVRYRWQEKEYTLSPFDSGGSQEKEVKKRGGSSKSGGGVQVVVSASGGARGGRENDLKARKAKKLARAERTWARAAWLAKRDQMRRPSRIKAGKAKRRGRPRRAR